LLVGGDSLVVAVFRDYFHLDGKYEVETIEYCDDALALLLRRRFDVVLVLSLRAPWRTWPSLSLPARYIGSESAILFLKQLRALHSQVPVIVTSFRVDAEAEALRNGAFAFVLKPVLFSELDRALAAASAATQNPAVSGSAEQGKVE
jgi:DNA-binding NarL/FixJ family response regulator